MRASKRGVAPALIAGLMLAGSLAACKSAEEKCEEARRAADSAWQEDIDLLAAARKRAVDTQAQLKLELSTRIEPRMSDQAAKAATARNTPGTDAWQRAFVAAQTSVCASDPDCARAKHELRAANDEQTELDEKLEAETATQKALRKGVDLAQAQAAAVVPDAANPRIGKAKELTAVVVTRCRGL